MTIGIAFAALLASSTFAVSDPPVAFEARPDLAENIEALPRLANDGAVFRAINADLDRFDRIAVESDCEGDDGYTRWVYQPMTGPEFITVGWSEEWFCRDTAGPSFNQTYVTYDLSTGARVDWAVTLPGLRLTIETFEGPPEGSVFLARSPALAAWHARAVMQADDPDWLEQCGDLYASETLHDYRFRIWAGAEEGGINVQPEFPRVIMACADWATMNAGDLRHFGADERLIEALAAAHAARNWAPIRAEGADAP